MVRSALSKVAWVGRATVFLVGLAVILALVFGVATTALGANGQAFVLGKLNNAATKVTGLVGNVNGAAMRVTNSNAGADDTALDLRVQAGEAPMRVNSGTRVANLNAASAGRADSAAQADTAANADKLDNKDSNEFVQNSGQTTFSVFGPWISGDPSVVKAEQGFNTTHFTNTGTGTGQRYIQLNPSLPSSLYGKSMLLTGVELCYNTSEEGVALGAVELRRDSSTQPQTSGGSSVAMENSPPDGAFCRTFSGTPLLMGTNSYAVLQVRVDWSAQTTFYIQRATFFLQPSNTGAAPQ